MIFDQFVIPGMSETIDLCFPLCGRIIDFATKNKKSANVKSQMRVKKLPIRFGHGWSLQNLAPTLVRGSWVTPLAALTLEGRARVGAGPGAGAAGAVGPGV